MTWGKSNASTGAAMAIAARGNPFVSAQLQQLWFSLLRRRWSTLLVLPTHPGGSSWELTQSLAEVARMHRGSRPMVIDARAAELGRAAGFISDMNAHLGNGGMVLIAADAVVENQVGIPLALASDAVLLSVNLGAADLPSARRTLELVGHTQVLGCVTVPPGRLA